MAKLNISPVRAKMYEQMSNTMALGRDEEAYDLMLSGVRSKPDQLVLYCMPYYYWCSQVQKWSENICLDYMSKLLKVAQERNTKSRR